MASRLERELACRLAPVHAPEQLWEKIQTGAGRSRFPKLQWRLWALGAAAATMALAWAGFCLASTSDFEKLAERQLVAGPEKLDFRSTDPAQIRAWVEARTGFAIPLAAGSSVQYIGVSLLHECGLTACISYRVGNCAGKLLVTRGASSQRRHPSIQHTSHQGAAILSWTASGVTYALAGPAKPGVQAGCILCHTDIASRKTWPRA
jgi:hypothetical protein